MESERQDIRQAIGERWYVRFAYDDMLRVVEPHVLGRVGDRWRPLAYQVELPTWRRYDLEKMSNQEVVGARFPAPRMAPSALPAPFDEVEASVGET